MVCYVEDEPVRTPCRGAQALQLAHDFRNIDGPLIERYAKHVDDRAVHAFDQAERISAARHAVRVAEIDCRLEPLVISFRVEDTELTGSLYSFHHTCNGG
jgi:hypothetical protein